MRERLASVVINNHNYGRFLREAIDSALAQTYTPLEVIVVDDGSTDDSRALIASYGTRVLPLYQAQHGQSAAMNLGFRARRGELVVFLDADDRLAASAVEQAFACLTPGVAKVHWQLRLIDSYGRLRSGLQPAHRLPEGDLRARVVRYGPEDPAWAPTSGNAWARWYLDEVLPLPEPEGAMGLGSASADDYLSMLAPLFGQVRSVAEPQGFYRLHEASDHSARDALHRLARDLPLVEQRSAVLLEACRQRGLAVDPEAWHATSWSFQLRAALAELARVVPSGERFILIDEGSWGLNQGCSGAARRSVALLEQDELDMGAPASDAAALVALERWRCQGLRHLVVAWPSFWWFDHYRELARHLEGQATCLLRTERVVVFALSHERAATELRS